MKEDIGKTANNTAPQYTNQLVAFLDVLASKSKINTKDFLPLLHSMYDKTIQIEDKMQNSLHDKLNVKIFSDNLLFARDYYEYIKISEEEKNNIRRNIIMIIARLQQEFLKRELLLRGGIAEGNCYFDKVMVMGDALIQAYKLESEVAIYPRIIISPNLCSNISQTIIEKYLKPDLDGYYYIDYISEFFNKTKASPELIQKCYDWLCQQIEDAESEHIAQKYRWLKLKFDSMDNVEDIICIKS